MKTLDARLLAAHARDDKEALVRLYAEAADAAPDAEAAAFYLTHAHVYALEVDHPGLLPLRQKLIDQGRELPLPAPAPRLG